LLLLKLLAFHRKYAISALNWSRVVCEKLTIRGKTKITIKLLKILCVHYRKHPHHIQSIARAPTDTTLLSLFTEMFEFISGEEPL
jgi:hypothetical protein